MTNRKGKIDVTKQFSLKVHTCTAPDDGWMVNTHFVELATQVIAIDAQYTIAYAKEALAYAATLGKPVTRLYVTHPSSRSLAGCGGISIPTRAMPEVIRELAKSDILAQAVFRSIPSRNRCLTIDALRFLPVFNFDFATLPDRLSSGLVRARSYDV